MFVITSENPETAKHFLKELLVETLKETYSTGDTQPKILDVFDVAAWLKCAPDTIREMAKSKKIPSFKPFKNYLFIETEVIRWIETQRKIDNIQISLNG